MELAKDDFDSILPFADGEDGRFSAEMFTKGRMSLRGSKLDISYEETEATGMQGSTTSLVFDVAKPKTVFMKRRGTHTSNMIFEANKTKSFIYGAEVMTLRINLFTKAVKNSIKAELRISTTAAPKRDNLVIPCSMRPVFMLTPWR